MFGGPPDSYLAGNTTDGGLKDISIDSSDRPLVEHDTITSDATNANTYTTA
jgi:hypothetical protein